MAKRLTNVQFMKKMMEHSEFGALAQAFIIDAVTKQAEAVAAADPGEISKGMGGFISSEAWVGVAKEIKQKMDEFYGS